MAEPHHTILVVDDNPDLLELLREGLSDHFTILLARGGAEGLTRVMEARPDCAIIDIRMPGVDGLQLVRTLRGDPETRDMPLIILTALPEEQGLLPGLLSGADRYLTKPALPSELIPAILDAITLSAQERTRRLRALALEEGES
jgi:CheY-like chemotaxis protein